MNIALIAVNTTPTFGAGGCSLDTSLTDITTTVSLIAIVNGELEPV